MTEPRPNPTTMEGMIWNANHVLEYAMKSNHRGLPKGLFDKAVGIVIINTVQIGLIFSGTMGSGIALRKTEDGGWSPPCAVGIGGLGFGILAGLSAHDLVVFVFDDETMKSIAAKHGAVLGAQAEATVGIGRASEIQDIVGGGNLGATFALAYSKGAFVGFQAKGSKIGVREFVNNKFYSAATTGEDILFKPDSVRVPSHKVTMLNEVYDKLNKCAAGATAEPDEAEEAKKAKAKEEADKEHEVVKDTPEAEIVEVDASKEEGASTEAS